jgi:hypothetical protein
MRQITTTEIEGYLHIVGRFEYVRKEYGGQAIHEPHWEILLFRTDTPAMPETAHGAEGQVVEDDVIEMWNTRILVAQHGGFMFYADGDSPQRSFHLSTSLPLVEEIFVFHVAGDPATITGKETQE